MPSSVASFNCVQRVMNKLLSKGSATPGPEFRDSTRQILKDGCRGQPHGSQGAAFTSEADCESRALHGRLAKSARKVTVPSPLQAHDRLAVGL
jgi:hypothetical protein